MISFGPVPSRRLGQSLGINNIPPKVCTYSCVYCQLGRTERMQVARRAFFQPEEIARDVSDRVENAERAGEQVDYLAFVPDGEPTLDVNLDREIELLRSLGIKIAVITNASLLWQEDVREALLEADWVSLKVDATDARIWHQIDRPYGKLDLAMIQKGMVAFADAFGGELVTETMLVEGVNDDPRHLSRVAGFVARLQPSIAYLSIPTRPPAEAWVRPPAEASINRAFQAYCSELDCVELLIGYEGNAFAATGNVAEDLLDITAVHPMREEAVEALLGRTGTGWSVVQDLIASRQLVEVGYGGQRFIMRNLH